MASPINIQIVADASGATKGIQDVNQELTKTATELDKVSKQSAETTAEQLRDFQKTTAGIKQETTKRVNVSKTAQDDEVRRSSETGKQVKEEAIQNASETFSSFDGTASSLVSGIQGTFGGLVAGLGGLLGGLAAAGGIAIGLIVSAFQKADAEAKATKADVSATTDALIELGNKGAQPIDLIAGKLKDLAEDTDDSVDSLDDLNKLSKDAGYNFKTLSQAVAGNTEGLDAHIRALKETRAQTLAARDSQLAMQDATNGAGGRAKALNDQYNAQGTVLDKLVKAQTSAAKSQKEYDDFVAAGGKQLQDAANDQKSYADSVHDALSSIEKDQKGGVKSFKQYLDDNAKAIQDQAKRSNLIADVYAKFGQDAGQALIDGFGPDVSTKVLKQAADAAPSEVSRYKSQYEKVGTLAGQQVVAGAHNYIDKSAPIPIKVTTKFGGISAGDLDNQRRLINAYYASHPITVGAIVTDKRTGQRLT